MSAYMVFVLTGVSDPAGLAAYRAAAPQSMVGRGVKFLAGPQIATTFEGDSMPGAVILEFSDVAAAEDWYRSPDYQAAARYRYGAASCLTFIVDGRV